MGDVPFARRGPIQMWGIVLVLAVLQDTIVQKEVRQIREVVNVQRGIIVQRDNPKRFVQLVNTVLKVSQFVLTVLLGMTVRKEVRQIREVVRVLWGTIVLLEIQKSPARRVHTEIPQVEVLVLSVEKGIFARERGMLQELFVQRVSIVPLLPRLCLTHVLQIGIWKDPDILLVLSVDLAVRGSLVQGQQALVQVMLVVLLSQQIVLARRGTIVLTIHKGL